MVTGTSIRNNTNSSLLQGEQPGWQPISAEPIFCYAFVLTDFVKLATEQFDALFVCLLLWIKYFPLQRVQLHLQNQDFGTQD